MDKVLDANDLISLEHSLVENLINAYYFVGAFKDAARCLSNKIGFGIDFGGFTFWSDLDKYDKSLYKEKFDDIEIEFGNESIILSIAGERYIEKNPQYEQEIEMYLDNIRNNIDG
ncbi:hypothetical protein [Lysinibacillus odysseyi]|uniref:CDI immunity protein domain-containing protein n=1 Tax=Lysinibacillus odysseyi 34hs-1 = NBRC 100172 TaxID=1220589 RepID=A0A0A3IKE8_9BACI|nr:hypothetical protein [Lysinibacillus odysseyi]KGR83945.1 hypothetical protein CD32_14745 [Lysinibacillus odysseyi 34hs-1 = NBRC 100172]